MSSFKRKSVRVKKSANRRVSGCVNKRKTVKRGKRVKSRRKLKSTKRGGGTCMGRECGPNRLSREDIDDIIKKNFTIFNNNIEEINKFRNIAANIDFPYDKPIMGRSPDGYTKYIQNASPKEQMEDYLYNFNVEYINNPNKLNKKIPSIDWKNINAFSR